MSAVVEIKQFIDERKMSNYQWLVVGLCFLVAMLDGIDAAAMGFIAPSLMSDFNISRVVFGPVLSAAIFGFAVGGIFLGPFADRIGRRKILILSVVLFGAFNASCALANTPEQLIALRFLTGIGLGTAMPAAATLLSEYVPTRRRSFLLTVMFAGFALGSGCAGFIASFMLADYGWRGVLLVGGLLPLLSVPLLIWLLPESARFLVSQSRPADEITKVLRRVCKANLDHATTYVAGEQRLSASKVPVQLLFGDRYALGTIMLWVSCFMGLLILYLVTGWLPTLIRDAGYSVQQAASIPAMFQVGSIPGALLVGLLMDRLESSRVVATAYFLGGLAIFALGANILNASWLPIQVAIAGFFIGGAQTGLNAMAPAFYPTQARATGVSWMNGIGRTGAIFGSLIGGVMLSLGWHVGTVFAALAMPAMIAAIAVICSRYAARLTVRPAA